MGAQSSSRRSRKRRRPGSAQRVRTPAAPDPGGPAPRSAREALTPRPRPRRSQLTPHQQALLDQRQRERDTLLGTYGERPENPFGGVPVSEIMIFAGAVAAVYGFIAGASLALAVGLVLCTLGVGEFTAREHFSGYRSHTTMLAAIPAIGIGIALIALLGNSLTRGPLLLVVLPVFGVCFWLLRKRFRVARHARIAKPPAP